MFEVNVNVIEVEGREYFVSEDNVMIVIEDKKVIEIEVEVM